MKQIEISMERQVTLDGIMTIGMLETGARTIDFECCEDVAAVPFSGDFHVQGMRDGNVYMQQKPRRAKNKPLYREDNASLSLGRDGRWYFSFSLAGDELGQLPLKLMRQAGAISRKVMKDWVFGRIGV